MLLIDFLPSLALDAATPSVNLQYDLTLLLRLLVKLYNLVLDLVLASLVVQDGRGDLSIELSFKGACQHVRHTQILYML